MKLRAWQADCLSQAHAHYGRGQRHFLCLATPGAGKTHMASTLAAELLNTSAVDLVICFAPSVIVADDFREALAAQTGRRFDGQLGASGCALTYQAMLNLSEAFWSLLTQQRVLVIFDEIHHCAGQSLEQANAWGERILSRIQDQARYTLALTGTPWRSDQRPIALARYGQGSVACDYRYGLDRAIADHVCRIPQLTLIDNDRIHVTRGVHTQHYGGFAALIEDDACRYEQLLFADALIRYVLTQAHRRLSELRRRIPSAGGLIVATSVAHAHHIARVLQEVCGETAAIATYREADPLATIRDFTHSRQPWIISVGMISEGTNVPRLRVCCHLTRVKTELYFRQVLGRILRANGQPGEQAYFFMPAEPTLVEYARRLDEDIPDALPVVVDRMRASPPVTLGSPLPPLSPTTPDTRPAPVIRFADDEADSPASSAPPPPSLLADHYASRVDLSGRFRRELLAIQGLAADG